jgi:class 3 adenylate cyclase
VSFRLKLALAMLLAVAGVAGVTLVVIHESIEATYRRMFEERFESDVSLLAALQRARLAAVESRCLGLARSVRLIAAMEEQDGALLYRIGLDELRDVLAPAPGTPGLRPATFFRFVGPDGRVLPSGDERAGLVGSLGRARWEEEIGRAAAALGGAEAQQVGYLAPEVAGAAALHEVVVTRIVDPVGGRLLGALALGFPVDDVGESRSGGLGQIRSGIWLEGQLYSRTIPDAVRPRLAAALGHEAEGAEPAVVIDGVPHRLFQRVLAARSGFPPASQVGLYSLAEPLARERELGAEMLAFGGLALSLALVASLVLSRSLAVPIRELAAAAGAVGRGDLGVAVRVRGRDEVGRLAASFNEMVAGLALKERYRSVLELVADREVAEDLIAGRLALGGELREASVLFCDVRGFTALSEQMAPGEVITLLNEHMTALTRVVYANGGVVDKFVGDQVIALFGVPRSTGRDAYAAVRAAWQMIAARAALNARAARPLEVGVGIASGTVVAGCLGSADRLNYTVLGERVNLAARLCAQAGRMEVLIDDETQRRLGALIRVDAVPPLALKGFSAPVAAYRLREVGPGPASS